MQKQMKKAGALILLVFVAAALCVIGKDVLRAYRMPAQDEEPAGTEETETTEGTETVEENTEPQPEEDIAEMPEERQIDFAAFKEKNPDIFAWIYIPGTGIDYPVLQSGQADDFYETHNADGEEDEAGAVYIELANLTNMSDFNTVLHGKTGTEETGLFADLYRFDDPDFFQGHETLYLYLDGNVLTYEIFAACERENTSLIRTYDFTYLSGCQQFLTDLYTTRDMGMNLREGWEGVNEYNYVITLTTQKEETADRQFIVTAVLIEDQAGTVSRMVME